MKQERLMKIILTPHVSEKTTIASEKNNEYAFHVIDDARKQEVEDAISLLFNVKVKKVRIVNVRPKTKMFRGVEGKRKSWKKAYVTLQSDQKLDMVGA
jgi:large subunit ribosomal protein L23